MIRRCGLPQARDPAGTQRRRWCHRVRGGLV